MISVMVFTDFCPKYSFHIMRGIVVYCFGTHRYRIHQDILCRLVDRTNTCCLSRKIYKQDWFNYKTAKYG
jgi:hypothetical protein